MNYLVWTTKGYKRRTRIRKQNILFYLREWWVYSTWENSSSVRYL